MKAENGNNNNIEILKNKKIRSVRNVFLAYFFISVISGRPEIFAALCAAFPFVLPMFFMPKEKTDNVLPSSLLCGVPGILISVLYLVFLRKYSTSVWLVPSGFAFRGPEIAEAGLRANRGSSGGRRSFRNAPDCFCPDISNHAPQKPSFRPFLLLQRKRSSGLSSGRAEIWASCEFFKNFRKTA